MGVIGSSRDWVRYEGLGSTTEALSERKTAVFNGQKCTVCSVVCVG